MADATIIAAEYRPLPGTTHGTAVPLAGKTLPELRKAYAEAGLPPDDIWAVAISYSDGMTLHPFRFTYNEYA